MRPVLEECAITVFCVEVLALQDNKSNDYIFDAIEDTRDHFRSLLKTYINGVIIPHQQFLISDQFDRSEFLHRINSLDILCEEASSIGSILKLELNRLKSLCKKMHISSKPFLCYNFSNVVKHLLDAIKYWFDKERFINLRFHNISWSQHPKYR